jgi:hypothetical protein
VLAGREIWQVTVWRAFRAAAEMRCGRNPRKTRGVGYMVFVLGCPVGSGELEHEMGEVVVVVRALGREVRRDGSIVSGGLKSRQFIYSALAADDDGHANRLSPPRSLSLAPLSVLECLWSAHDGLMPAVLKPEPKEQTEQLLELARK